MDSLSITMLVVLGIHSIAGGFFKAVSDTLQFHYHGSVFNKEDMRQFWNPVVSWRNKYLHGMKEYGPKFWGSTTWFVWITDGWHLFQSLGVLSWTISLIAICNIDLDWYWFIAIVSVFRLLRGATFQLFYNKILYKK